MGESTSQVAERPRLEASHTRQNNQCECGAELQKYEIDHIIKLCGGGEDDMANADVKHVTCHAEKSGIKHLGAVS